MWKSEVWGLCIGCWDSVALCIKFRRFQIEVETKEGVWQCVFRLGRGLGMYIVELSGYVLLNTFCISAHNLF